MMKFCTVSSCSCLADSNAMASRIRRMSGLSCAISNVSNTARSDIVRSFPLWLRLVYVVKAGPRRNPAMRCFNSVRLIWLVMPKRDMSSLNCGSVYAELPVYKFRKSGGYEIVLDADAAYVVYSRMVSSSSGTGTSMNNPRASPLTGVDAGIVIDGGVDAMAGVFGVVMYVTFCVEVGVAMGACARVRRCRISS